MSEGPDTDGEPTGWAAVRAAFTRNVHLKSIALLLTLALYLWVGADTVTRVVAVPFEISVPSNQVLLEPKLDTVKVTLEGRSAALDRYERNEEKAVELDLSAAEDGQMLAIPHRAVDPPPGLRVVQIEPSFIRVEMAEKRKKEVPVQVRLAGEEAPSHEIGEVTVDPSTVMAHGPREVIEDLEAIPTRPVDVSGRGESFTTEVRLRPDSPMIRYELDRPVRVSVTLEVEKLQRVFEGVDVRAVNTSLRTELHPSSLEIALRGPRSKVEPLSASELYAVADLSGDEFDGSGTFEIVPTLRNLPDGVEVVRTRPDRVVVTAERPSGYARPEPDDGDAEGSETD